MHLIFTLFAWLAVWPLGAPFVSTGHGPGIDPLAVHAASEEEGDPAPGADPLGTQAASEDDGDHGPGIDPYG